jgi:hypothetical protein
MQGGYRVFDERRMVMRPGPVGLHLMPPISTAGLTRRDLPELMAEVRAAIDASLVGYERAAPPAAG